MIGHDSTGDGDNKCTLLIDCGIQYMGKMLSVHILLRTEPRLLVINPSGAAAVPFALEGVEIDTKWHETSSQRPFRMLVALEGMR